VCILLVFLTYVYHEARFRECTVSLIAVKESKLSDTKIRYDSPAHGLSHKVETYSLRVNECSLKPHIGTWKTLYISIHVVLLK